MKKKYEANLYVIAEMKGYSPTWIDLTRRFERCQAASSLPGRHKGNVKVRSLGLKRKGTGLMKREELPQTGFQIPVSILFQEGWRILEAWFFKLLLQSGFTAVSIP